MPEDWAARIAMAGVDGAVSWTEFDPVWYARRYLGGAQHAQAAFADYTGRGVGRGHDPNPYFSEGWMRRQQPDLVSEEHPTAFAACLAGRSPAGTSHWLFDLHFFQEVAGDLTSDRIASEGFVDLYDQYLRLGHVEGRRATVYFDPIFYLVQLDPQQVGEAMRLSPYRHFLIRHSLTGIEVATSPYFNPGWYLHKYPQAVVRLARRASFSALDDFLYVAAENAPNEFFDEAKYLAIHPDVAADAEQRLSPRAGYLHFIRFGAKQGYAVPGIHWNEEIAQSLGGDEPFGKFIIQGVSARDPEDVAKALFRQEAADLAQHAAIHPIDFSFEGEPDISVMMVLYNQFELVLGAITSLRANTQCKIELILVDSGSSDEITSIESYLHGARIIRPGENIGFLRGCNLALTHVRAPYVLYLNTDVLLCPGAVDNAIRRLDAMPGAAAVGGKVVRSHGLLQEAGNLVFSDGSTIGRLRDRSPLSPEANYLRDVDYVSGAFMLLRTQLVQDVGGFDMRYAPAYYEETDLCVRLAQRGWQIVYDPAIAVRHHEFGSAQSTDRATQQMAKNQVVFREAHADWLKTRPDSSFRRSAELEHKPASWQGGQGLRILYVDDTIPRRRLGSGFVRSNDIANGLAALGHAVTVFPANGTRESIVGLRREFAPEIEIIHDRNFSDLSVLFDVRGRGIDLIWVGRAHNLDRLAPLLRQWPHGQRPQVVLDSEAVFSCRDAQAAKLEGRAFDLPTAVQHEFRNADLIDAIAAVNETEARLLHDILGRKSGVIGTMVPMRLTDGGFADRHGFLMVGAIHAPDAPNLNALHWLADAVLDQLEAELGFAPEITVAGYVAPGIDLSRFAEDPRFRMVGTVDDLAPLYAQARVFLAPTRVAAGTPYKIYETASFGLPSAISDLLATQMGWQDGSEARVADVDDAAGFARAAADLYRDPDLWERVRAGAARNVAALTPDAYRTQIAQTISSVRPETGGDGPEPRKNRRRRK